ncbi:MAG: mechanosensitive ion channel domain-containing protein [Chthoniobacterales bacterium]
MLLAIDATTAGKGQQQAAKLLRNFQDISFLEILSVVAATWLLILLIERIAPFLAERGPSRARLFILGVVPVLRLLLLAVSICWILPLIFNFTTQNFLVIFGAASVALGFAFKDLVSSVVAGVVAVWERPYRPGDWVKVNDAYGEVCSVGSRSFRLRTADDTIVTVPHLKLWDTNIYNSNDGNLTLMCVADFYLEPAHDAARVRLALRDVALTSAFLQLARPVFVIVHEKPWGTHYRLKGYPFDARDQFQFLSDLTVRGKEVIAALGAVEVTAPVAVGENPG